MAEPYYYDRVPLGGPSKPKRPWWVWPPTLAMLACIAGTFIAFLSGGWL